jgi:hypothetical protein
MSSRVVSLDRFLRQRTRVRRRRAAEERPLFESVTSGPARALNDRERAHRRRMLNHLRRYNG